METAAAPTTARHSAAKGLMPIAIIRGALFLVAEDVVSLADLLEFLLGSFVAGVLVGMELHRQLAVGLLHLVSGGSFADAEDFVIVALGHGEVREVESGKWSVESQKRGRSA